MTVSSSEWLGPWAGDRALGAARPYPALPPAAENRAQPTLSLMLRSSPGLLAEPPTPTPGEGG